MARIEAKLQADRISEEQETGKRIPGSLWRPTRNGALTEPAELPEVDLDVVDVRQVVIATDAQGDTMISLEMVGGQVMNLILSPEALAKLEANLAKANEARAKISPIQ